MRPAAHGERFVVSRRFGVYRGGGAARLALSLLADLMTSPKPNFDNCMCTETRVGRVVFPANDIYLYRALAECGEYCRGEASVYKKIIRPGMTVLDVGANIGLMSLLFARTVGNAGTVHAFEPSVFANNLLRENIGLNGLGNIRVRRAAVSDTVGKTSFVNPDPASISSFNYGSLSLAHSIRNARGENVETDQVTVDSIDLHECDFIKIDVEGFEAAVVRGALRTIDRCKPWLSLEIGNPKDDVSWVPLLKARGYRIFAFSAYIFSSPNFKARNIDDLPKVVCASAIAVPPGKNQMEVFGPVFRREILGEKELQKLNATFTKDDLRT